MQNWKATRTLEFSSITLLGEWALGPKRRNPGPLAVKIPDRPIELEGLAAAIDDWKTLDVAAASIFQLPNPKPYNLRLELRNFPQYKWNSDSFSIYNEIPN